MCARGNRVTNILSHGVFVSRSNDKTYQGLIGRTNWINSQQWSKMNSLLSNLKVVDKMADETVCFIDIQKIKV